MYIVRIIWMYKVNIAKVLYNLHHMCFVKPLYFCYFWSSTLTFHDSMSLQKMYYTHIGLEKPWETMWEHDTDVNVVVHLSYRSASAEQNFIVLDPLSSVWSLYSSSTGIRPRNRNHMFLEMRSLPVTICSGSTEKNTPELLMADDL